MTSFWEILKSSKSLKASDAFAELWGKSISETDWDIITITGTLPLTFEAKGEALKNYRLYGTSEGAGVETVNLVDKDNLNIVKAYINSNDTIVSYNTNGLIYVPVVTGETYTISGFKRSSSATDIKWGITASIPTNNVSCTRVGLLNQSSSITVTITSGEAYLCIFLCGDSEYSQYGSVEQAVMKNAETGMIIPGSTAPASYIPYGYQIPLTNTSGVTENLFDKDAAYQVSAITNNYTLSGLDPAKSYTCSTTLDKPSGATAASIYFSLTTSATAADNGVWSDKTVTLTPNQDGTILVSTRHTAAGGAPAVSDDVINGTIKIMVNEGSTALPYIPHRYTADYNLYIGSTKLGAEEYVDYQEQKAYKRTVQLFDKSKALIGYRVASTGVQQNNSYSCSDYIEIVAGEEYKVSSRPSITNWYFYDNTKRYLSYAESLTATAPTTAKYVRVNISNTNGVDTFMLTVSTEFPETYIPYLQPTDPPAPFPAIATYKGENTLSSTETVGEVSVTGKIKVI